MFAKQTCHGAKRSMVTHVMINDPTVGYGIFVENMLVGMPMLAR